MLEDDKEQQNCSISSFLFYKNL